MLTPPLTFHTKYWCTKPYPMKAIYRILSTLTTFLVIAPVWFTGCGSFFSCLCLPAGKPDSSGSGFTKPDLLCAVEGAVYSECGAACPPSCLAPFLLCLFEGCFPGCMCPEGQLIDGLNNRCVPREQCPSPGVQATLSVRCIMYPSLIPRPLNQ